MSWHHDRECRIAPGYPNCTCGYAEMVAKLDRLEAELASVREVADPDNETPELSLRDRVMHVGEQAALLVSVNRIAKERGDQRDAAHAQVKQLGAALTRAVTERDEAVRRADEAGLRADRLTERCARDEHIAEDNEKLRAEVMQLRTLNRNQAESLRWPNNNMHGPVAELYAEHFPSGAARDTLDRFQAVMGKLTAERDNLKVQDKLCTEHRLELEARVERLDKAIERLADDVSSRRNHADSMHNLFEVYRSGASKSTSPPKSDAELHADEAHPEWEYETTKGPRKSWEMFPYGPGWTANKHRGRDGWEHFDFHDEAYWMRRKAGRESK